MSGMEWREIEGFPQYEVSEFGDLRRKKTLTKMRGYINADGYPFYSIRDVSGLKRHIGAHQLVAAAFLGPPDAGQDQIAHRNGSRLNCHHSNLRWSTSAENHADARLHGTGPSGERNPKAKITEADVHEIRARYRAIKVPGSGMSVADLEAEYGLSRSAILDVAMGRTWAHVPFVSFAPSAKLEAPHEG